MSADDAAKKLLQSRIEELGKGGQGQAAKEVGVSATTLSQFLAGKYPGRADLVAEKIIAVYGQGGLVACPAPGQGAITPSVCADNRDKAKRIGVRAGNPDTKRLYNTCLSCRFNGGKGA